MSKKGFFKLRLQIRKRMTHALIRLCIKTFPPQENKGMSCRHIPSGRQLFTMVLQKGADYTVNRPLLHCNQVLIAR